MVSFTRQEALEYHRRGRPGKIQVTPSKPLDSQGDYTADILGTNGMSTDDLADIICEQLG